jgi:hypothetical protein
MDDKGKCNYKKYNKFTVDMSVMFVVMSYGSNMDGFSVECLCIKVMDTF